MNHTGYRTLNQQVDLLSLVERDVPALKGTFRHTAWGGYTKEVPCPMCGGNTRFWVAQRNGVYRAFCRHCASKGLPAIQYLMWRYGMAFKDACRTLEEGAPLLPVGRANLVEPPPEPLDPEIALAYHRDLGRRREYFQSRGIPDWLIDQHRLGWRREWRRYTIPGWQLDKETGELECWNIQCRITPEEEQALKEQGVKYEKYLSERGSHQVLFNADVAGPDSLYTVVVEGRVDALAAYGLGLICVACPTWRPEYSRQVSRGTVILVADNDKNGVGQKKALEKQKIIGRGVIVMPPVGKDLGEYLLSDWPNAKRNLEKWLKVPLMLTNPAA